MRLSPDLPPIWTAALAALAWALARWVPILRFDLDPLGRVVLWLGVALILWSAVWFAIKWTPIEPGHKPKALIVEGPYRLNRNPIYTGLVLVLAGYALGLGALSALLPVPVLPLILTRRFIRSEETALIDAFGAAGRDWIARTRRW